MVTAAPLFRPSRRCIQNAMVEPSDVTQNQQMPRSARRQSLLPDPDRNPGFLLELPKGREGWLVARRIRIARRALGIVAWTVPAVVIQIVCLIVPGRARIEFPKFYWAIFTRLIGIRVRVIGNRADHANRRPVIFISNHSSWIDVPVLGGVLDGCFVAKGDVVTWP